MQAIILAAGMGRRLKDLTKNNTKCMVEVNGTPLINRLLDQLERKSLSRIVIVLGYEGEKLKAHVNTLGITTPIVYIDNPIYDKTNNIYSLALAKEYLTEEDTLLFESDLIFEESLIDLLLEDERDTLALVDKYEAWMDGTCIRVGEDDSILDFIPGKKLDFSNTDEYYKTVNIYKFAQKFSRDVYVPFLEAYVKALGLNEYYEQVLKVITILEEPQIKAKRLNGEKWYEIDDVQDLDIASTMFETDKMKKLKSFQNRYGGYWRYPKMLDFCYLVNPYYPPQQMLEELKASFDELITQYPSGMKVNSLVAARNYSINPENIVVGNGAAELIKAYMSSFTGKVGVVRPTFEEYPNRYQEEKTIVFRPENSDYSYSADDIIEFFDDKALEGFVLVNPDNPSGNFIDKAGLIKLADWAEKKNIKLLIDESFVDFADPGEDDNSMIHKELLESYRKLAVMKSISKSCGVPGIRLGILASGDVEMIAKLKKDVAIWNINSFGEFYLQLSAKYEKAYAKSLIQYREERARFGRELNEIAGLRVVPSQANYFLVELTDGSSAVELAAELLEEENIFIKELSSKLPEGEYIRLAVRDQKDNDRLIAALKKRSK